MIWQIWTIYSSIKNDVIAKAMSEPKSAGADRMDAVTAAAVMPCVGGFIFYVGQSRIEDRPDFENQNNSAIVMVRDAGGANRKRIG